MTLPGNHSEGMAISRDGKKLYVNLTGPKEVGVVDLDTKKLDRELAHPGSRNSQFDGPR